MCKYIDSEFFTRSREMHEICKKYIKHQGGSAILDSKFLFNRNCDFSKFLTILKYMISPLGDRLCSSISMARGK